MVEGRSPIVLTELTRSVVPYGLSLSAFVVYPHEVAAPAQFQLAQHDVATEDSRRLQYMRVGDSILPPQPQDTKKTIEVEVVQSACLFCVHCPSLRSVQQHRQDDGLVHLHFRAELYTMRIPKCALKAAEGSTGLRNPAG
nr:unnamed protein product [Spirometra erinaceieuropaei]